MWRDSGLTVHKEIYLAEKQLVKSLMETAMKDHFLTTFKECAGDQVKTCTVAEQIVHNTGCAALPNTRISVNSLQLRFPKQEISWMKVVNFCLLKCQPPLKA